MGTWASGRQAREGMLGPSRAQHFPVQGPATGAAGCLPFSWLQADPRLTEPPGLAWET